MSFRIRPHSLSRFALGLLVTIDHTTIVNYMVYDSLVFSPIFGEKSLLLTANTSARHHTTTLLGHERDTALP